MAVFNTEPTIRTGIKGLTNRIQVQRKPVNIRRVDNPILNTQIGSSYRANKVGTKPPFDLEAIRNAYWVDSYVRQGLDKYVEIVLKEGYILDGEPEQVKYLTKRFKMMGMQSGEPWGLTFERMVRDFVKYGNSFLLAVRSTRQDPIPGLYLKSLAGKTPIGAYFNVPSNQLEPELDENGKILSWLQKIKNRQKVFSVQDILHFTYCKEAGGIWGIPPVLSVIEDIRALRQLEESVIKLCYKFINPLIHISSPDITGTQEGRQEDIDDMVRNWQTSAPDGIMVTPPGWDTKVLGMESQALRVDSYLKHFQQRVFTGLGVSELIMGMNTQVGMATADALTAQTHHRAKIYQFLLTEYVSMFIFNELLMEGGFDPWNNEKDVVILKWNEIEIERQIKEQTHAVNLWTLNAISSEELRSKLGYKEKAVWTDFYSHRIQIPQLIASKIGADPLDIPKQELKSFVMAPSTTTKSGSKTPTKTITTTNKQASNTISPSNKTTGPRAKAGAPTAHKMSYSDLVDNFSNIVESIIELIPRIRKKEIDSKYLEENIFTNLKNYSTLISPLCNILINDILNSKIGRAHV